MKKITPTFTQKPVLKAALLALMSAMVLTACDKDEDPPVQTPQPPVSVPVSNPTPGATNFDVLFKLKLQLKNQNDNTRITGATVTLLDQTGNVIKLASNKNYNSDINGLLDLDDKIITQYLQNFKQVYVKIEKTGFNTQILTLDIDKKNTFSTTLNIELLPVAFTQKISNIEQAQTIDTEFAASGATVSFGAQSFGVNGASYTGPAILNVTPVNPNTQADAFPGNARLSIGSTGQTNGSMMVSAGMVDFTFNTDEATPRKLQLLAGKTANIIMPLFSAYNEKGNLFKVGDSVDLWSMDAKGQWQKESVAKVVSLLASPTGLGVQGDVSHFSFWNTDFANNAKCIPVITNNQGNFIESVVTATFTQVLPGASKYPGLVTVDRNGSIDSADDQLCFAIGFDAELEFKSKDGTLQRLVNIKSQDLASLTSLLVEYNDAITNPYVRWSKPVTEIQSNVSTSYNFVSNIANVQTKAYVDGILGGNANVGTIEFVKFSGFKGNFIYKPGSIKGKHTLKIVNNADSSIFDTFDVEVLDADFQIPLVDQQIIGIAYPFQPTINGTPVSNYTVNISCSYDQQGTIPCPTAVYNTTTADLIKNNILKFPVTQYPLQMRIVNGSKIISRPYFKVEVSVPNTLGQKQIVQLNPLFTGAYVNNYESSGLIWSQWDYNNSSNTGNGYLLEYLPQSNTTPTITWQKQCLKADNTSCGADFNKLSFANTAANTLTTKLLDATGTLQTANSSMFFLTPDDECWLANATEQLTQIQSAVVLDRGYSGCYIENNYILSGGRSNLSQLKGLSFDIALKAIESKYSA